MNAAAESENPRSPRQCGPAPPPPPGPQVWSAQKQTGTGLCLDFGRLELGELGGGGGYEGKHKFAWPHRTCLGPTDTCPGPVGSCPGPNGLDLKWASHVWPYSRFRFPPVLALGAGSPDPPPPPALWTSTSLGSGSMNGGRSIGHPPPGGPPPQNTPPRPASSGLGRWRSRVTAVDTRRLSGAQMWGPTKTTSPAMLGYQPPALRKHPPCPNQGKGRGCRQVRTGKTGRIDGTRRREADGHRD